MPLDSHGRTIDYLRLSLTDQCNLRCVYCMPMTGLTFAPREEVLTASELALVAEAAASVGFRKIRFTGGEPTLREDLLEVVERIARTPGIDELCLTTNGVLLSDLAEPLARAGLTRVNVHVDSLDDKTVRRLMRYGSIDRIWAGIEAAERAGLTPLKLNCVVTRGYNEDEVVSLASLTLDRDWHVRFVELMPLGEGECAGVARSRYVSNVETRSRIEAALGELKEVGVFDAGDESRNVRVRGARGIIGFISPVSEPYCGHCNRMRLTADGRFHLCLLNDDEMDVKRVLRSGGDAQAVASLLVRAVEAKPVGHRLERRRSTRHRQMYQIGG